MKLSFRTAGLALAAGALATAMTTGIAGAQVYKGKRINIIINYAAGGNTDIQGRMVMRHMKNYVPGKPRFIFRHISGAGGIVGANFLAENGRTNGMMMGIFTIPVMSQIMKAPELRADLRDFHMVGAIAQQTIAHVRIDAIPGVKIKNYKDFLKNTKHVIRTAGHGPSSTKDLNLRLTFDMLKIPYKHVTGFKSAGKIRAAIMKDEIDLTSDSVAGYFGRVNPQLIKGGVSVPLWHIGHPTADGDMRCSDTVPASIPCFLTLYEAKFGKGKRPPKMEWAAMRKLAATREMLRIIVFRKGTPMKYVEAMRGAWAKTMKDKAFQKEYVKANSSGLVGMEGAQAQKYLRDTVSVPADLQKYLLDYANAAKS